MALKLHSLGLFQKISLKSLKKPNCGSVPRMRWLMRWWALRSVWGDPLQPPSPHEERPAGYHYQPGEAAVLCCSRSSSGESKRSNSARPAVVRPRSAHIACVGESSTGPGAVPETFQHLSFQSYWIFIIAGDFPCQRALRPGYDHNRMFAYPDDDIFVR